MVALLVHRETKDEILSELRPDSGKSMGLAAWEPYGEVNLSISISCHTKYVQCSSMQALTLRQHQACSPQQRP